MKFIIFLLSIRVFLSASETTIPEDLLYKGKPIPDFYFFCFVDRPDKYDLNDQLKDEPTCKKITFEWDYLGTYHGKYHACRTYYWDEGAMGKFTQILLLKREGDQLEISDVIYGGDRHASGIFYAEIDGSKVVYIQHATSMGLMELAVELFPDIQPLYNRNAQRGFIS